MRSVALLFALLLPFPALAVDIPTDTMPLGNYVHDWQIQAGSTAHTGISGVDPVEHPDWAGAGSNPVYTPQVNKDRMFEAIPTHPVGLGVIGKQPSELDHATPGDGFCPSAINFSASSLASLSLTVSFAGGPSNVPLIYQCDFLRAFTGSTSTLSDGVCVAILHSAVRVIDASGASSGCVILIESLAVGHTNNLQGVLKCQNTSACHIIRSEVLLGSDVLKIGSNDRFIGSHFHGYTCVGSNCGSGPHFDVMQVSSTSNDYELIANFCDGPFRDSQNCLRGVFTPSDTDGDRSGPVTAAYNWLSGGRQGGGGNGNSVCASDPGGWTGDCIWYANRCFGSTNANTGISWQSGACMSCSDGVGAGQCYGSANVTTSGETSGSNGNAGQENAHDDETFTSTWTMTPGVGAGSLQEVTQAQIDMIDAEITKYEGWIDAAYTAASVSVGRSVTITSVIPGSGAPSIDTEIQFGTAGFGTLTDCDIHATGANTFDQDLSTPFSPATIPGSSLQNTGTTNLTIECTDGTPATSAAYALVLATPGPTLVINTDNGALSGAIPLSVQITGSVTGTQVGTSVVELDETCNGSWDSSVNVSSPTTGDQTFAFTTPANDAGPYNFSGIYCVRVTRNSQTATATYTVTVFGTPPQIMPDGYNCFYDTTKPAGSQKTTVCPSDNALIDRDSVGIAPNYDLQTTEYDYIGTYAGPSCIDVVLTYPPSATTKDLDQKNAPWGLIGDGGWEDISAGIIKPTIDAAFSSPASFAAPGAYRIQATPRDVDVTPCTGGNSGTALDLHVTIADAINVSVPTSPTSSDSFTINYDESGADFAACMADCDGDGTFDDDVVNETTEQASCTAQAAGTRPVGVECSVSGLTGTVSDTVSLTVLPSSGDIVRPAPIRVIQQ